MTRERKLAVMMWRKIAENLDKNKLLPLLFAVAAFKKCFCEEHNLHWLNDCWFCQYIGKRYTEKNSYPGQSGCSRCPLKNCVGEDNLYGRVVAHFDSSAANKIADILEKGWQG